MQFLLFPPPLDDEWIGSWLVRLAEANLVSLKKVLSLLGISSPDLVPDPGALQRLAAATYLASEQIAPMVLLPEQTLKTIGSSRTAGVLPYLGVTFLQVCPRCLDTDPVPYIRKQWLLHNTVQCEIHGGPLLDRCPSCKLHLQIFRPQKSKSAAGPPSELRTAATTMRQCRVCQSALTVPAVPMYLLPPPPTTPVRYGGLSGRQLSDWPDFARAIEEVLTTFVLTDISMHFNEEARNRPQFRQSNNRLSVIALPKRVSNRFTADSRFKTALLFRTLLTSTADADVHEQVVEFGRSLSIHLSREGGTPSSRWRYVRWLMAPLRGTPSVEQLTTWPAQVRFLTAAFLGRDSVRRVVVLNEFRVTDEQWQAVDDALAYQPDRDVGGPEARRNAFEGYMLTLFNGIAWKQLPEGYGRPRDAEFFMMGWEDGTIEIALELLYRHLQEHQLSLVDTARSSDLTSWQAVTTALFLSDSMLDLLFRKRRELFQEILTQLVFADQVDVDEHRTR